VPAALELAHHLGELGRRHGSLGAVIPGPRDPLHRLGLDVDRAAFDDAAAVDVAPGLGRVGHGREQRDPRDLDRLVDPHLDVARIYLELRGVVLLHQSDVSLLV
jgi:hypothetical protein